MVRTRIELETAAKLLGVFLHYPGNQRPQPLPGVEHSCELDLASGNYSIVASGTGIPEGTAVKITVSTDNDSKHHTEEVSNNGEIIYRFSFDLQNDGTIIGGDW